jgi:hypothetical protein
MSGAAEGRGRRGSCGSCLVLLHRKREREVRELLLAMSSINTIERLLAPIQG